MNAEIKIEQFDSCTNMWFISVQVEEGHDKCVAILSKYDLLKAIQKDMTDQDLDLYLQAIKRVSGDEE